MKTTPDLDTVQAQPANSGLHDFATLLSGEAEALHDWLRGGEAARMLRDVTIIIVGAGCYGAAMGWWRAPEQALFVAIKFPLIILLTALGNAFLNAMLAPLLGLNITLRQSFFAVLMGFVISSAILGAFSPLTAFLVWNAPPLTPGAIHSAAYLFIKLSHVAVIAFAGAVGNLRLRQSLLHLAHGDKAVANRVLMAWLVGNFLFGSQLSWLLRPFIGAPHLPVQFLRPDIAFQGNFYENVLHTITEILSR